MIDNFETVGKAHGILKSLRSRRVQDIVTGMGIKGSQAVWALQALVDRAAALPEEPTCAELLSPVRRVSNMDRPVQRFAV
jgi:hypothetical protein